jgi:hypothetical protein
MSGEDMKQKKPVTREIWKIMIRRYQVAAIIGFAMCVFFFWQLAHLPLSVPPPMWMWWGTGFSGLIFFGGLFGMAISYFFHFMRIDR